MADKEALLRLRLTAQNEANPAFTSAADAMKGTQTAIESSTGAIKQAFDSMTQDIRASIESISTSINGGNSAFTTESRVANEATESIQKSFQSMEEAISAVVIAVRQNTQQISSAIKTMATNVQQDEESTGKKISEGSFMIGLQMLGQSMQGLGETGAHMFDEAIKSSAEFEANISRIHAVLMNREPTANMEAMKETALKLGSNSKFSANEIAQGMYDLARQGLSSTQILGDGVNGAIEVVNNLAQATDTSMPETAKVITDVTHEFGISGDQLSKVGDMISGAMHSSSISMTDFYYAMRNIGPVASNMHQNVDDVSTAIALLAQHGVTGGAAGTALKNMFLGLEPRTKKAAELMHELGINAKDGAAESFYQLNGNLKPMPEIIGVLNDKFAGLNDKQKEAALSAVFTKYGLNGLTTVVMEGKDKFEELKKTLSDEKAADIAKEKMNNLQGDMWKLNASVETAKKSFGDTLAPAMRSVAQAAQGIVNWFTSLDPSIKQAIMVVGGITSVMFLAGGAILGVVSTLGFLQMGLAGLVGEGVTIGSLAAPFLLVVAAVAALGFAAFELITHWSQVTAWVKQNLGIDIPAIWNALKSTADTVFHAISDVFSDVWNAIKKVTQDVWDYIGPTVHDGLKAISDFWNEVWPQIKEVFIEIWEVIKAAVTPYLDFLKFQFDVALGFIKGAWHDAWNAIKDSFKLVWDLIADILRTGWDWITGLFKIALDLLTGNWGKAWDDMKSMLSNVWNDINKLFGDFQNNALQFGKDLVMSIAHGIEGAIDVVISAAKKVVSAITSIFSSAPKSPTVSPPPQVDTNTDAVTSMSDDIPAFGDGGKVTKPTLAMVGERGETEYIIPESKLRGQDGYTLGLGGMAFGGGMGRGVTQHNTFNFTINGAGKDGQQIGNDIMSTIRRQFAFSI